MCGIAGILPAVDEKLFKKGLDAIAHRGPDGFGIWKETDDSIMLGHRRLAILDLSDKGKQPMLLEKYVISFNGEIYNFIELKNELKQKGYHFLTESDTEVIVAAFDAWGHACLQKFNGMWAFAIWNRENKTLFISRDRFGKKPLFYSFTKAHFVFASEMKAITPFFKSINTSNDFGWCKENVFLYEATAKTLIEGISRFPAASYAYFNVGDTKINPIVFYNPLDFVQPTTLGYVAQVEKFRETFIDACAIRMRSDVPIGTALSGGLDSSAVISTIAYIDKHIKSERISHDWQHAFVACFEGSFLDERKYAKQVVDHLAIPATYLEIDPISGIEDLMNDLYYFEELYITSPIPMMRTYSAIKKQGVTVSIDGHGADEMMSGYGTDMLEALLDAGINVKAIADIIRTYRDYRNIPPADWTIKNSWNTYATTIGGKLPGTSSKAAFYLRSLVNIQQPRYRAHPALGYLNNVLYDLFHKSVLPTLLRNYDRYAMANGVEIRMPFMDHRLVEFAFSIPWSSKIKNGFTKSIIRDATAPFMPASIAWRKSKIGFNTPIVEWLKGPWKNYFLDHIASSNFLQCDLIDHKAVKQKVEKVIFNETATWAEGEEAWYAMQPYFWQQGFFNRIKAAQ